MKPNFLFSKLETANADNLTLAENFLTTQEARGGTLLRPALTNAYKYRTTDRPLNTVILSDGMTEQQERSELIRLIDSRPNNVRVFCIGVGNEINRPLLRQIAEDSGGLAAFISQGDDLKRQAKAFQRKLMHPVATDLNIRIDGLEVYDLHPRRLPNLYHGMPVRLYGRYRDGGEAAIRLDATINGRPLETSVTMEFPKKDDLNPEIERMWARHAIDSLQTENGNRPDSQLVDEIIRLGEAYSITSEYTSFLVLENDNEYKRWKIKRNNALRIDRDRKAQQRLRAELEKIRESSLQKLGPVQDQKTQTESTEVKPQSNTPAQPGQAQTPRPSTQPDRSSQSIDLPRFYRGGGAFDGWVLLPALPLVILMRRRRRDENQ